ncbi:MAG: Ig-like domain-containing protein [Myxococcota bacterium]
MGQVAHLPQLGGIRVAVGDLPRVDWTGLRAWDADGVALSAWIDVDDQDVRVSVDDARARYPVTIDPLITGQPSQVALETGVADSALGWSIDSDGDRLIIGDPGFSAGTGAMAVAYPHGTLVNAPWTEPDLLTDSGRRIGWDVALEGMNAATVNDNGAITIFQLDAAGNWIRNGFLLTHVVCSNCFRLEFADERLIAGITEDTAGRVEVRHRYSTSQTGNWETIQTIDGLPGELFGADVAADARLLAVGAPGARRVKVYRYDGRDAGYTYVAERVDPGAGGSDFGRTVAMSGTWLAVGAPGDGRVNLYRDPDYITASNSVQLAAPTWAGEGFGSAIALFETALAVTDRPTDPEVPPHLFVYERGSDSSWVLRESFDLSPGGDEPLPVTISDGMVAVGEPHTSSFRAWRRQGSMLEEIYRETQYPNYISGMAVDGDIAVVAGPSYTSSSSLLQAYRREGASRFDRTNNEVYQNSVGLDAALSGRDVVFSDLSKPYAAVTASAGASHFTTDDVPTEKSSKSVAMDSEWLILGAPSLNTAGGAYVYRRVQDAWVYETEIDAGALGAQAGDGYGSAVAIRSGAIYLASDDAGQTGAVMLVRLERESSGGHRVELIQQWFGATAGDQFGYELDVDGDLLVVGKPGANAGDGGFYLYRGTSTIAETSWRGDGSYAGLRMGSSLSLRGDTLVTTAPGETGLVFRRGLNAVDYTDTPTEVGINLSGIRTSADLVLAAETFTGLTAYRRYGLAPPTLRPDNAYTDEDNLSPVYLDVLANDLDPNGDLITVTGFDVTDPPDGSNVSQEGNRLVFRPPGPDYDLSQHVTYTVTAGGDTVEGYATFNVRPLQDCPRAYDDLPDQPDIDLTLSIDEVLDIPVADLLANDVDPDTFDTLHLVRFTQPGAGSLVQNGDVLTFTPASFGLTGFDYTIADDPGCESTAHVTIDVRNEAPRLVASPSWSLDEDELLALGPPGLAGEAYVVDPDGDPLTVSLTTPPDHGTLVLAANGSLLFTPEPEYAGRATFAYAVADAYNAPLVVTATLDFEAVNDPPVGNADGPFHTLEERPILLYAAELLVNDRDVDSTLLQVRLDANQPAEGGTATLDGGGNIIFQPDPDFSGTATVWYLADDGQAKSAPTPVTVEVAAINDAPEATNWAYGEIAGPVADDLQAPSNGSPARVVDPDGDALTILVSNAPAHGTVTMTSDGKFTYTPTRGFTGSDKFYYTAHDPEGVSSPPTYVEFLVVQDATGATTTISGEENHCAEPTLFYLDADGDGFGTPEFTLSRCTAPDRYVERVGDCDDTRFNVHPGAREVAGDGVDQDCDGRDNDPVPVGACTTGVGPVGTLTLLGLVGVVRRRASPRRRR